MMEYRKIKNIDTIGNLSLFKNDINFRSWKAELNKELQTFWESICE